MKKKKKSVTQKFLFYNIFVIVIIHVHQSSVSATLVIYRNCISSLSRFLMCENFVVTMHILSNKNQVIVLYNLKKTILKKHVLPYIEHGHFPVKFELMLYSSCHCLHASHLTPTCHLHFITFIFVPWW